MSVIALLSPQVADMIAAGEVVERPASAVKELIENSMDAGATRITVEIKNGGKTYIRVTDNGSGINKDEVRTAFLRHATSKIRTAEDLERISTMGFRGEALAALASVAKVDMFTKTADAVLGTHISIAGGEVVSETETGCSDGTNIIVRDLFYNIPARFKFMKKDSTEASRIEETVVNAAIARPDIAFNLIKDGRDFFSSNGNGKTKDVLYSAFGKETAGDMIFLKSERGNASISGFVAKPDVCRANRNLQLFFLNNRPIKSKVLVAAADEAYKGRLVNGKYGVFFLMLKMPPESFDINVHPQKLDAKFNLEREVFVLVKTAVAAALDSAEISIAKLTEGIGAEDVKRDYIVHKQDFFDRDEKKSAGGFLYPRQDNSSEEEKKQLIFSDGLNSDYVLNRETVIHHLSPEGEEIKNRSDHSEPEKKKPFVYDFHNKERYITEDKNLIQHKIDADFYNFKNRKSTPERWIEPSFKDEEKEEADIGEKKNLNDITLICELFKTYIIAEYNGKVWIIDKHAAHERQIYNKLKAFGAKGMEQILLKPMNVFLSGGEKDALLSDPEALERMGFELSDIGGFGVMVRSVPSYISEDEIPSALSEIAEKIRDNKLSESDKLDALYKSMACKAAIKAGMKNDPYELRMIAVKALLRDDMRTCPHGRPAVLEITKEQLEKLFKRIV